MITEQKQKNSELQETQTPAKNGDHSSTFEQLLAEYEPESLHRGQYVEGEILQIDEHVIFADVDAKRTAVVPPQDLQMIEDEELAKLSVGDEVFLYVLRTPVGQDELIVSLNKGLQYQDWIDAKEYLEDQELLELEVVGHNKGGLMVSFGQLLGFVPISHVPQLQNTYDKETLNSKKAKLIGEQLPLVVIEVDPKRQRLVLSAKKAQKEVRQQRLLELKLQEGQKVTGRVTNLVRFGAFIELDGAEGLIHISEIAWQKVTDPAEYLKPGDEIEMIILSVDVEEERISLSRKALLPSPWELLDTTHNAGDLVEGTVTHVREYGAFVMIEDGVEGLIHVSEMRGPHNMKPQEVLFPGDTVLVRILDIQPERQRMGLSQRKVNREEETQWIWQQQQDLNQAENGTVSAVDGSFALDSQMKGYSPWEEEE
ncbi:MAG: S1 RNA-binding domain-containing protein [Candidatus Promineifilaceae bacterium]|nr:S1 RNA-binding domain-containing protein [Candidatus Promineifilaceae bacterium]